MERAEGRRAGTLDSAVVMGTKGGMTQGTKKTPTSLQQQTRETVSDDMDRQAGPEEARVWITWNSINAVSK